MIKLLLSKDNNLNVFDSIGFYFVILSWVLLISAIHVKKRLSITTTLKH